jgi:acyl carrier protein
MGATIRWFVMNQNTTISLEQVRGVLVETLGIDERAVEVDAAAPLLGEQPELDSMGVLALLFALEQSFGIGVDGDDVTVEVFETLGSLTAFVDSKLA